MLRYSELAPYDTQVVEVCLAALGQRNHPAGPLLKGRLAAAEALTASSEQPFANHPFLV